MSRSRAQDLFSLNVGFGRGVNAVCDLEFNLTDHPGVFLGHWPLGEWASGWSKSGWSVGGAESWVLGTKESDLGPERDASTETAAKLLRHGSIMKEGNTVRHTDVASS